MKRHIKLDVDKIALLMAKDNITQIKLAKSIGLSRAWLSQTLMRGLATANVILRIAKGLDVPVDEIIIK